MVRRLTPSQIRSLLRQAQQKQQQAINKYNNAVRKYNSDVKRAVGDYNREVRAHNQRVRTNRQRLRTEIARLNSQPSTSRHIVLRQSAQTLHQSFVRVEAASQAGTWHGGNDLFEMSEGETANSVEVLNALLTEPDSTTLDNEAMLRETTIAAEMQDFDPDFDARWRGALFALHRDNPDAARHFCTSAREILTRILETEAPDDAVKAAHPNYHKTPNGGVSRRARVRYCLNKQGSYDADLEAFVEADLDDLLALFHDFNAGTHGNAGRFGLDQLAAIKKRVEGAIRFLHRLVR